MAHLPQHLLAPSGPMGESRSFVSTFASASGLVSKLFRVAEQEIVGTTQRHLL